MLDILLNVMVQEKIAPAYGENDQHDGKMVQVAEIWL